MLETALWVGGQGASEKTKGGPEEGGESRTNTGARSKTKTWASDHPCRRTSGMLRSLQDTGAETLGQETMECGGSDNR